MIDFFNFNSIDVFETYLRNIKSMHAFKLKLLVFLLLLPFDAVVIIAPIIVKKQVLKELHHQNKSFLLHI